MSLFEMLNRDIEKANEIVEDGDEVILDIFHIGNRHKVRNPTLIKEKDGIYITNNNGSFYNLKHFADIELKILNNKKRKFMNINEYLKSI